MARLRGARLAALTALALVGCPEQSTVTPPDAGPSVADTADLDVPPPKDTGPEVNVDAGPTCAPSSATALAEGHLGVRITTPAGTGSAFASGAVAIGGVLLGAPATFEWRRTAGSGEVASGAIDPVGSWQTEPIPLLPGDNLIEVTAADAGGQRARDQILVISSSAPLAGVRLRIAPDHVWTNETQSVRATLLLPSATPTSVSLVPVTPAGAPLPGAAVPMTDDGSGCGFAQGCDEIADDRTHTACFPLSPTLLSPNRAEFVCFRAEITFAAGTVRSPVECVMAAVRPERARCEAVVSATASAQSAFTAAGGGPAGLDAALAALSPLGVTSSGRAGLDLGVWAVLDDGLRVALPLGVPAGLRGNPVGARAALLVAPPGAGDISAAKAALRPDRCPPLQPTGPLTGAAATLAALRTMGGAGVLAFGGHAGVFFAPGGAAPQPTTGPSEVLFTGEPIDCSAFLDAPVACADGTPCPVGTTCHAVPGSSFCASQTQADVADGRAVFGPGVWGITPAFVDHYGRSGLPRTIVYLGGCQTARTGSLALAFLGAGASAVVGYDGLVRDAFANDVGSALFEGLGDGTKTVGQALCLQTDPDTGTSVRLFGSDGATLAVDQVLDTDFEDGLRGWLTKGDVRTMPVFCGQKALEGKSMALLSTGIGFGGSSGEMTQTFCIPKSVSNVRFKWRYFSAELEDFCGAGGTSIQDQWDIRFERGSETVGQVKSCDVDDMCLYDVQGCQPKPCAPPSTGCGCGDCYEPYEKVDACNFCGQPVQATGIVEETYNVSSLAGGAPVTLRVKLRDSGDGVNDTVLLLDGLKFE
jgi:hypothetical protein